MRSKKRSTCRSIITTSTIPFIDRTKLIRPLIILPEEISPRSLEWMTWDSSHWLFGPTPKEMRFPRYQWANSAPVVCSLSADFPPSSPFATGVGGTSLALNSDGTIKFQTGWGTNATRIADISPSGGTVPDDNPRLFRRFLWAFLVAPAVAKAFCLLNHHSRMVLSQRGIGWFPIFRGLQIR